MLVDPKIFTKLELPIYDLLKDGMPHPSKDLLKALGDKAATSSDVANRVYAMRKKLLDKYDMDIAHRVEGRRISYVLVKRLYITMDE